MKRRIKKNRFKYLVIGFLTGVILMTMVVSADYILKRIDDVRRGPNLFNSDIEAPYYRPRAFQTPADLMTKVTEVKIKIPIIVYHYVEYVRDMNDLIRKRLDITPDIFEKQLATLHENGYRTYFIKDIPDMLDGQIVFAAKSAILTFDDGYEDFYHDVFPILKKYQMKATIYIIYDYIGRRGFLNEKEIKELVASGLVEVGSHTLDHLDLKYAPALIARKQIFESKKLMEERFGIKVATFAYPYGAFTKKTADIVKEASYSAAVSVIPGIYQSTDNIFYLSRVRAGGLTSYNMIKMLESYNK